MKFKVRFLTFLFSLSLISVISMGQVTVQYPAVTGAFGDNTLTQSGDFTYGSTVGLYSSANLSSYWGYITSIKWKGYGSIAYNLTTVNAYLANTTNTVMSTGLNESYYRTVNGTIVTNPAQIISNGTIALSANTSGAWLGATGLSYLLSNGQNLYVTFHADASSANYAYFAGSSTTFYGGWGAMSDNGTPSITVPPGNGGDRPDITVVFGAPTVSVPSTANVACTGTTSITVSASTLSTSYQWLYCPTSGGTYTNVANGTPSGAVYSNATTNALGINGINVAGNYYYKCIAYNGNATNTTSGTYTTLTVGNCCTPPTSVILSGFSTPICSATDPGTFTANASGGSGGSYTYLWYQNGSSTGVTTSHYDAGILTSNTDIYCAVSTGSGCTTNSGTTTIVVDPITASVTMGVNQNNVCSVTVVTFTATPVNGGTPSYQWYLNGIPTGADQPTFSYTPANNDQVYVDMTSSFTCVSVSPSISDTVTMAVMPGLTASVSIGVSQNNVCTGTQVTFTATPTNGGTPSYQWYLNGNTAGTDSTSYSMTPANNDEVYVVMTSNASCVSGSPATSSTIKMNVNPLQSVSVVNSVDQNNVCAGTAVTFTATPANGGTPSYQWYLNGTATGANQPTYSYTPADTDKVYVVMTSTASCISGNPATSDTVTMTIIPNLPASVIISLNNNNVCTGSMVTFTAVPTNGGTPSYQWFLNGNPAGTDSVSFSFIPVNNDAVYAIMTSSLSCATGNPATSNTIKVNVIPYQPAAVSILAGLNNVCAGTQVTTTATPVNGGTPSYQWYLNGAATGANQATYSYTPADTDKVYVVMTSTANCVTGNPATSDTVTMSVTPNLSVNVSIGVNQNNICAGIPVTFTATPANGGAPSYQWYLNNALTGTNFSTYSYMPANNDQVYVVLTSSITCQTGSPASSNTVMMVVDNCTAIQTISQLGSTINIYPNPANNRLFVNFSSVNQTPLSMKMFNSLGQLCFETNQPLLLNKDGINVSPLNQGTYTLQIIFKDEIVNKTVIIN